jgi:hypothetical protein
LQRLVFHSYLAIAVALDGPNTCASCDFLGLRYVLLALAMIA